MKHIFYTKKDMKWNAPFSFGIPNSFTEWLAFILAKSILFVVPLELHCTVWSRLCKAGTTGTEQREDAAEDGGIRLDWKSCEWQGGWKNAVRQLSELICAFKLTSLFQTLSFYFPPCGKIPPPVIMVQNVSFRYSDNTVSINSQCSANRGLMSC